MNAKLYTVVDSALLVVMVMMMMIDWLDGCQTDWGTDKDEENGEYEEGRKGEAGVGSKADVERHLISS